MQKIANLMTSLSDKNVIRLIFHIAYSLVQTFIFKLGSEIALSIVIHEFTRLQNRSPQNSPFLELSVTPSIYRSPLNSFVLV